VAEIARIALEATGVPFELPEQTAASIAAGEARIGEVTRRRWYPVVDCDRCGHCLECLNFCLFGVFGLDDSGRLFVEQPDACRDGCPACSRICPSAAIMFPDHNNAAIAGSLKAEAVGLSGPLSLLGSGAAAATAASEREAAQRAASQESAAERPPAVAPAAAKAQSGKPTAKDELDRLVDELDQTEL
jgi:NAD-dependent dihydropyrimidine dehydrogenase PreA subunit